jgi:hypothetical protein
VKPLPDFHGVAAVSGLDVSPSLFSDRRGLVVVHGAKNGEVGKNLSKALRAKHPDLSKVLFVSIVDMRSFSGLWRKVAEAQLKATYTKLAEKVQAAGGDPRMAVIIVPDWDGSIAARLGAPNAEKEPLAIVVRPGGAIAGTVPAGEIDQAIALV